MLPITTPPNVRGRRAISKLEFGEIQVIVSRSWFSFFKIRIAHSMVAKITYK